MISPQDLASLFHINSAALNANVEGITHQESILMPEPSGNCMNWVLGHILHSRSTILEILEQKPVISSVQAAPYQRGSVPNPNDILLPFDALVKRFVKSQELIHGALNQMDAETLSYKDEDHELEWRRQPVGDQLIFLHFHECYHVGQTGLLRRIIGKEGAIA